MFAKATKVDFVRSFPRQLRARNKTSHEAVKRTGDTTIGDKALSLSMNKMLYSHPDRIQDEQFLEHEFFDSRDVVQVRYEMIRRCLVEGQSVCEVAKTFGVSRQTFYQLLRMFKEKGIVGLLPRPRGPLGTHRLNAEIIEFAIARRNQESSLTLSQLVSEIADKFGIHVHPRTLARKM